MSKDIERIAPTVEQPNSIPALIADHALWVCFLNPEGYETFEKATFRQGQILLDEGASVREGDEISTIQFWQDGEQVTVVPTGHSEEGTMLFQTVETLLAAGELPAFTARSLAKRLQKQPHRVHPGVAISPLLKLPPFAELQRT